MLIANTALHRDLWPLGQVSKAIVDVDNCVRTVYVRTQLGEVLRDVRHICLLEAGSNCEDKALHSVDSRVNRVEVDCDANSPQVGGGSSGLPHREEPLRV